MAKMALGVLFVGALVFADPSLIVETEFGQVEAACFNQNIHENGMQLINLFLKSRSREFKIW